MRPRIIWTKEIIASLTIIAVASGIFWSARMWGNQTAYNDDKEYKDIALNILEHHQYQYEGGATNIEPVYPLFLASIFAVFGPNNDAVRIVQIGLFAMSVLLIYALASIVFGYRKGYIISVLCALFYALAATASVLNREIVLIFLLLALTFALYRMQDASLRSRRWYIVAGILTGLLTLTNGVFELLFIFIVANIIYIFRKHLSLKKLTIISAIYLVSFGVTLLPWYAYNLQHKTDTIVSSRKGLLILRKIVSVESIYRDAGLNVLGYSVGYYFAQLIKPDIIERAFPQSNVIEDRQAALLKQGLSYSAIDKLFTQEAIAKIKAAPQKYIYAMLINAISLNSPVIPDKDTFGNVPLMMMFAVGGHNNIPMIVKAGILLSISGLWWLWISLVICAIARYYRDWSTYGWLILVIVYVNGVYTAIHGIPRFALPVYPLYAILSGASVIYLYNKYQRNFRSYFLWLKR